MKSVSINDLPLDLRRNVERRLAQQGSNGYDNLVEWLGVQGYEVTRQELHRFWQQFNVRAKDAEPRPVAAPAAGAVQSRPGSTFADVRRAARRRDILLLAEQSPRIGLSEELLALGLEGRGLAAGRDAIALDVTWLEGEGLVRTQTGDDQRIVIITQRGSDVARGLADVPGVARVGPEAN
jgi:hypothetical protein